MTIITDLKSIKNYNAFKLRYERKFLYGYDGPEDGFYKWLDTKQQEQQGSNKQRGVSLKDCNKMAKRTRNSTLFSKQKGSDSVQDKTMYIPSWPVKGIDVISPKWYANQDRDSLCSPS